MKKQNDSHTPSTPTNANPGKRPYQRSISPRRGAGGGHGPGQGMPLGQAMERAKDFKGTLRRLISFLRPQMHLIILMLLFIVAVTIISVITPNYTRGILNTMQMMIDNTVQGDPIQIITRLFLIVVMLYIVSFFLETIAHLFGNFVSAEVGKNFRNALRYKLERLPIKYFDQNQTGNTLSIFSNDVEAVTNSLQQGLTQIITSLLTLIGVIAMMFVISWKLTLITLAILPLYILITTSVAKRSQSRFIRQQRELGHLNGYIEEMFSAHKVVKLYGREQESFKDFQEINSQLSVEMKGAQFLSGLIRPLMEFVSNVGYVLIVIVGGILAGIAQPLLIGDITTFVTYHRRFMNPILALANMINTLQAAIAGAERIFGLLDQEEETLEQTLTQIQDQDFRGEVRFEHVDFSYTPEQNLIQDLNLVVQPGKQIAIVGPTGAGKTTLVNLLMRFYEIDQGRILIDQVATTDVARKNLRQQFGMVLQDTWLFAGTIFENVAYGKDDATLDEVIEACKQAHVHHFIETLPKGYDTPLNEDATNISQGQKQLLTIARAILFNPRILILDEATSSVDTRTEAYIQNAMNYMIEGRTSFVIAHRLSTIKRASVILVMQHGKIVEQGSHEALLKQGGVYEELYRSQFLNPVI